MRRFLTCHGTLSGPLSPPSPPALPSQPSPTRIPMERRLRCYSFAPIFATNPSCAAILAKFWSPTHLLLRRARSRLGTTCHRKWITGFSLNGCRGGCWFLARHSTLIFHARSLTIAWIETRPLVSRRAPPGGEETCARHQHGMEVREPGAKGGPRQEKERERGGGGENGGGGS